MKKPRQKTRRKDTERKANITFANIFVQPIPRGSVTHVQRQAGLPADRFIITLLLPSRLLPVANSRNSRITVTRSCRICTCFPFHLRSYAFIIVHQTFVARRHLPFYVIVAIMISYFSKMCGLNSLRYY